MDVIGEFLKRIDMVEKYAECTKLWYDYLSDWMNTLNEEDRKLIESYDVAVEVMERIECLLKGIV